jgi:hypothetical protein
MMGALAGILFCCSHRAAPHPFVKLRHTSFIAQELRALQSLELCISAKRAASAGAESGENVARIQNCL